MQKDASSCPSWERYVNVYRQFMGSNEGLDDPWVRSMSEEELGAEIVSMQYIISGRNERVTA